MNIQTSRRSFLKATAVTAGYLVLGLGPTGALAATADAASNLTPFVIVGGDGAVTVVSKHFEGGQGACTGLATLIAEEMNMELREINVVFAPSNPTVYNNLFFGPFQATGGSTAIANSFTQYRTAAAAAREMLIDAAAKTWSVSASELTLKDGVITGTGKSGGIGEFAAVAAKLPVPEAPKLKDPSEWRQIGSGQRARCDTFDKIDGSGKYSMDVQLDGQIVVAIKRTPRLGGAVASFDDSSAKGMKGFIRAAALPNGAGVAVYAANTWAAFQARDAIEVDWDFSKAESRGDDRIKADMFAALEMAPAYHATATDRAAVTETIDAAAKVVERDFYLPLLAHAPMEPMNATIEPTADGGAIMHDGAQGPTMNHQIMHQILQIPMEKLQVKTLYAGGFFGRRMTWAGDYLVELTLAYAMTDRTRPVKLVWSREDDITGGYYRPQAAHRVRVGLDDAGHIVGWSHHIVTPSIFKDTSLEQFTVKDGLDHSSVEGTADGAYTIPGMYVGLSDAKHATTVNWWRSVGHSHTAYVMESMMDLAAAAAGIDPVEFRLKYLSPDTADGVRSAATLKLAAEKAGWGNAAPGRAQGVAVHKSFGTYCAQVCEVSTDSGGAVRIEKVTAAVDCGIAVNPDVVKAQIEGGIGYGIGHVMRNKITLEEGEIVEQNFPDYEPLRIGDIGAIDVHIVPSAEAPTGVGEPGTPPAGPALANAIAAVGGPRVSHLPMIDEGVEFA